MKCWLDGRETLALPINTVPALLGDGPTVVEIKGGVRVGQHRVDGNRADSFVELWPGSENSLVPIYRIEKLDQTDCYRLWIGIDKPDAELQPAS